MDFQFVIVVKTQPSDTLLEAQRTVLERAVGYWRKTKHQIEPQLASPLRVWPFTAKRDMLVPPGENTAD